MPKNKILIAFESVLQLWQYAQHIQAVNIEINTRSKTLLCECSEEDLALLSKYGGRVVQKMEA